MAGELPYYTSPGVLTVDLKAVAANYRYFKEQAGVDCAVAGIVKANAYGLGMKRVAPVLEKEGCRHFFVATLEEGISLRSLTKQPIYVLDGFWPGAEREYHTFDLVPVLNSLDEIKRWQAHARWVGRPLPAVVHFDTGMNRLGLGAEETKLLLDDTGVLKGLDLKIVMSHMACADEKGHAATGEQLQRFDLIAARFPDARKSLANSSAALRDKASHYGMIRPGMAVYGLNPLPEEANPMKPVASLDVRLLQVRDAEKGEAVGYGASHRLNRKTKIGTVALGYADGFLRSGSGKAVLFYKGKACPVIGRVSMDLVTVDLGDTAVTPGDRLEVLGPNQDADALAATLGTIGYEVLTGLGLRWGRSYV